MLDFLFGVGRQGEIRRYQISKRGYEGSGIEEQDDRVRSASSRCLFETETESLEQV